MKKIISPITYEYGVCRIHDRVDCDFCMELYGFNDVGFYFPPAPKNYKKYRSPSDIEIPEYWQNKI